MKPKFFLIRCFLVGLFLTIGFRVISSVPAQSTTLLVGAATSLKNALEEIEPLFAAANSGITINYSFAASGSLQQQIEQGAPIDIFIAAANKQMDSLQEKKLILADTRRNILSNSLVLVVPRESTLGLGNFVQLTNSKVKRIAVGEPRSVPVGQYGEAVFRNLGILEQLRPKFVFGNSVRNVLASVASGNADAGIVYATDAKITNKVKQVAMAPPNSHPPIVYPMAIVSTSRNRSTAHTYADFLTSPKAQAVFKRYGFGIPQ